MDDSDENDQVLETAAASPVAFGIGGAFSSFVRKRGGGRLALTACRA